jgi:hypothetical protein
MRIIHSFWSKPMLDSKSNRISNLSYSSWVNKNMFYYTYALSTFLVNKYYSGKVTLVTDKFGKELLIDTLKLPYDEVIVELDYLNQYPKQFWALGKIYTYSLMNQPFIHLDYDFFLVKSFDKSFENADLVAYMDENDEARQRAYIKCMKDYFVNYTIPTKVKKYFESYENIAFNAGVFGGTKIDIFKDLWSISQEIIETNAVKIADDTSKGNPAFTMTNVILEQYLFACIAKEKEIKVECLHQNENLLPPQSDFWLPENNIPKYKAQYYPDQYVHMCGAHKACIDSAIAVKNGLKKISPESFSLINQLLEKQLI